MQSNQLNSICAVHICPSICSFSINFDVRLMCGQAISPRFRRNSNPLCCAGAQSIDWLCVASHTHSYRLTVRTHTHTPKKKTRNYCVLIGRVDAIIRFHGVRRVPSVYCVKWVPISTNWKSFQWIKSDWKINNDGQQWQHCPRVPRTVQPSGRRRKKNTWSEFNQIIG